MTEMDARGLRDAALAIPDHLRDALWRIESARLGSIESPMAFVCGMGGSAIGGDLAAAALGDRLTKPLVTVRGYELPSWAPAGSAVLCSSYSGDTEETLACYSAAEALGAKRIAATTGGQLAEAARADGVPVVGLPAGMPPRAAVGYMFCVAAELAVLALAAPRVHVEIDTAAVELAEASEALAARAAEIADVIGEAIPVIYGSGLTAPAAYRWKSQINENAKLPSYSAQLPEADHNDLVGMTDESAAGAFAAIFLDDSDQHPRERERIELTAGLLEPSAGSVTRIALAGDSRTSRLLQLVMLGDLVSLELADRRGVDPVQIEAIDELKRRLGSR